MKKIIFALIISSFLLMAQAVMSQTPKRIQLTAVGNPATSKTATIKGKTGRNGVYYVVSLTQSQIFTVKLSPIAKLGIKVEIDGADGPQVIIRREKGGTYTHELSETGDYTIFIGSTDHKSRAFTLKVTTLY